MQQKTPEKRLYQLSYRGEKSSYKCIQLRKLSELPSSEPHILAPKYRKGTLSNSRHFPAQLVLDAERFGEVWRLVVISSSGQNGLTLGLAQVIEPCGTVELDIGDLDLAVFVDVEVVDTLDLISIVTGPLDRDPAPANAVAVVENVQRLQ